MSRALRYVQPRHTLGEKVWEHALVILERKAGNRRREREDAAALLDELMALPAGERLPAVEREERFWTPGLLDRLLAAAEQQIQERVWRSGEVVRELAELGLALALRLDAQPEGGETTAEQTAVAWCLRAQVHHRQGELAEAERGFRAAARRLGELPLEALAWARYGRLAAFWRWEQGWPAEALGLLQRAARLFDEWGEHAAAGEVLSEQGWLCLRDDDPGSALEPLLGAVARLDPSRSLQAAVRTRYGLALCHTELGARASAEKLMAEALALERRVPDRVERLRFARLEAGIVDCGGDGARAIALLEPLVGMLLSEEAFYDAAIVAVDLAELYAAAGRHG